MFSNRVREILTDGEGAQSDSTEGKEIPWVGLVMNELFFLLT